MKNPFNSLAGLLLTVQVTLLLVISLVMYHFQYAQLREIAYAQHRDAGLRLLSLSAELLAADPHLFENEALATLIPRLTARDATLERISLVNRDLTVVADSDEARKGRATDQTMLVRSVQEGRSDSFIYDRGGNRRLRLSRPIHGDYDPKRKSDIVGAIAMEINLGAIDSRIKGHLWISNFIFLGWSVLFLALQWAVLRWGAGEPLRRLTRAAQSWGKGAFAGPGPARSRVREISDLGEAITETGGRLEKALHSRDALQTKLVQIETTLLENIRFHRALIEASPLAMIRLDRNGRVSLWNPAAEALFGWRSAEVLGRPVPHIPEGRQDELARILERVERGEAVNLETVRHRRDGSTVEVSLSISPLSDAAGRFAGYVAISADIGKRKRAETEMQQLNKALAASVEILDRRNKESDLLNKMGEFLQSAADEDEGRRIIARFCKRFFPAAAGGLYLVNASRNLAQAATLWGETAIPQVFPPEDCWAIRLGRIHRGGYSGGDLPCLHGLVGPPAASTAGGGVSPRAESPPEAGHPYTLCLPMTAQGEALGILHLHSDTSIPKATEELARTVAEHCALALANLRLRGELREQSIRDPLTGLFNRRYLETALRRELAGASRGKTSLALFMLDIDHFKRFNDEYGHEAGDAVLKTLGDVLMKSCRRSDLACRFGGEEFTVILSGTSLSRAKEWADRLMVTVRSTTAKWGERTLPPITVSLGLALFPEHGPEMETLLQKADMALYEAKKAGRNRLTVARQSPDERRDAPNAPGGDGGS